MLKECLKKNGKTYYFTDVCFYKRNMKYKVLCTKYKAVDNNAMQITPAVDYIEVKDDVFFLSDKVKLNDNVSISFYFYVNEKGLPVSPCYNDLFSDEMFTFPVTSREEFIEKYDEIISNITNEYINRLKEKYTKAKDTCMQLAMHGKNRKHKREKKRENKV